MNIVLLLEMAVEGMGGRVAVGPRVGGLTYRDLLDRAHRTAAWLSGPPVQHVGLVGVASEVVPTLLFGGALAGVPFAPVNFRLADDRLRAVVQRLAPASIVADAGAVRRVSGIAGISVVTPAELAQLDEGTSSTVGATVDADGVAVVLFTSGTTGDPKAARLRHHHLASYVLSTVEFMGAGEDEAALVSVPPYHVAGIAAVLSNVYAGRRVVYLPAFEPLSWVRTVESEQITHAMVVPTMLGRVLDVLDEHGPALPSLRHLSYGGGRMPTPTIERALDLLPHVDFVNAYGLTETSSTVAVLGPDDHRTALASTDPGERRRLGSVGRPLPTVEIEVRGPDGRALPAGETGEVFVRGEQVAGEYAGVVALTSDGWFPTNDGGWFDAEGYLYVDGRLDDVIVRGGENMSPGEIEDVLLTHPGIVQAAVVGVADDDWGEAVAAVVVPREGSRLTSSDVQDWVRTHLRSSRVPSIVDVREELPVNDTGKLLRRVLRAELRSR